MEETTLRRWSHLAQVVSAIGVIVSLVYVGLEIRSNTEATRAATRQAIAETDFEYIGATLDPRTLLVAEAKLERGSELTPTEQIVLVERQHLNFRIFENAYYQYEAGLLDAETWERYRWIMNRRFDTSQPTRTMWEKFGPSFDESFREEVRRIRSASFEPR